MKRRMNFTLDTVVVELLGAAGPNMTRSIERLVRIASLEGWLSTRELERRELMALMPIEGKEGELPEAYRG